MEELGRERRSVIAISVEAATGSMTPGFRWTSISLAPPPLPSAASEPSVKVSVTGSMRSSEATRLEIFLRKNLCRTLDEEKPRGAHFRHLVDAQLANLGKGAGAGRIVNGVNGADFDAMNGHGGNFLCGTLNKYPAADRVECNCRGVFGRLLCDWRRKWALGNGRAASGIDARPLQTRFAAEGAHRGRELPFPEKHDKEALEQVIRAYHPSRIGRCRGCEPGARMWNGW